MARECKCHADRRHLVEAGVPWHEAHRLAGGAGYHEHRCECGCGCTKDTCGYAKCAYCSWEHPYQNRTVEPSARAKKLARSRGGEAVQR